MDGSMRRDEDVRTTRRCPECGGPVACMSGCEACLSCGQSRCAG